jgi:hypothetical protein
MRNAARGRVVLVWSVFLDRRRFLRSGRRVKGREVIASDAVGALDAAAVTGILRRRGRRLHAVPVCVVRADLILVPCEREARRERRAGRPTAEPGADAGQRRRAAAPP